MSPDNTRPPGPNRFVGDETDIEITLPIEVTQRKLAEAIVQLVGEEQAREN